MVIEGQGTEAIISGRVPSNHKIQDGVAVACGVQRGWMMLYPMRRRRDFETRGFIDRDIEITEETVNLK